MAENTIVRFEDVSFEHGHHKQILDEVSFPIRRGGKITLMGQNGAGKSTLFGLITGALKPEDGTIHIERGLSIALSRQVIPRDELKLTVREFFQKVFPKKMYDIDPRIDDVLEVVHLKGHEKVHDRMMSTFSGGQQARLLLASALIQKPDLLLLDEPMNNAQMEKIIIAKKEKANYFAMKGGQLRLVAKRMRAAAAEAEEAKVEVRREDKTIKPFHIPCPANLSGELLHITSFKTIKNYKPIIKKKVVSLRKNQHLLLKGPNGIGKSTLLGSLANGEAEGATITKGVKVGYYRQDFSNLDFNSTVYEELAGVMAKEIEGDMRHVAAGFLITVDLIRTRIGHLSEGQKGLVAFARLVLMKPGLLILDEPTNHINFSYLPVVAKGLDEYDGGLILVSHVPEFVAKIRIDDTLDLEK